MTLVIETCCSVQDQNSIKTLFSQEHPLCQQPLVRSECRPEVCLSRGAGKSAWQPSTQLGGQGSGPFQASLFSGLLKSVCKAESLGSGGQQAASSCSLVLAARSRAAGCTSEM